MGGRPPRNARRRAGQPATRDPIAARRAVAARYVPHRVRPATQPGTFLQRVLRAFHYVPGDVEWAWDGRQLAAAIPSDQQLRLASPPDRREHRRDPAAAAEPAGRVRATTRGRQHPGDHGALGCTRTAGQRTIHRTLWRRVVHQQRPVPRPPRRLGRVGRQLLRRDRRRDAAAALAPAAAAAFAAGVLAHAARRARPSADARARLAALRPGTRDARRATRRRPATRRLVHALLRVRRAGQPVHRVVAGQQRRRIRAVRRPHTASSTTAHIACRETDPGTTRPAPPACRCRRFPTGRCRFAYSTRSARPACAAGICRCASGIATT